MSNVKPKAQANNNLKLKQSVTQLFQNNPAQMTSHK